MKHIWAPWRIDYIKASKTEGCFLCQYFSENKDEANLILARGPNCAVVMNRYPYTGGHLMICPYRHISEMNDMTPEEQIESMKWATLCVDILRKHMKADGFNVGINLGDAAGAGLKDHIHMHVVPRWIGDTNFVSR